MSHNPSLSDLRRFNVRNLRGQGVVTARTDTRIPSGPRGMNDWERRYATHLTVLQQAGEIASWKFEAVKLRLADGAFYKPDFLIVFSDGRVEFVEIKGHWREAAKVRVKVARELFAPIPIRVVRPGSCGDWIEEVI